MEQIADYADGWVHSFWTGSPPVSFSAIDYVTKSVKKMWYFRFHSEVTS